MSICGICREAKEQLFNAHTKFEHLFCKECLDHWVSTSDSLDCPVCRGFVENCARIFDDKAKLLRMLWWRDDGYVIIKGLLEEGLDPGNLRDLMLMKAIDLGEIEIVRMLVRGLEQAPRVNPAGLVKTGQLDLLQFFMTSVKNMHDYGEQVLYELVKHDMLNSVPTIAKAFGRGDWNEPLVLAATMRP